MTQGDDGLPQARSRDRQLTLAEIATVTRLGEHRASANVSSRRPALSHSATSAIDRSQLESARSRDEATLANRSCVWPWPVTATRNGSRSIAVRVAGVTAMTVAVRIPS